METQGHILVVDDEFGIREGCRRVLVPAGFEVETASTLAEGRELVAGAPFDLVLLDVMLPDGRGLDLLEVIHARDPEAVAVIITGYATVELAVEAIKAGAYDFISKPFTSDLLLMAVNQGLEKRHLSLQARRLSEVEAQAVALAHAKDETERLQQFQARFTNQVAHELRSPVTSALSLIRTMTRGLVGDLAPEQAEMLGRVERRLEQLLELVDDLLNLAVSKTAVQDAVLERVDLGRLLARLAERFAPDAGVKGVALTYAGPFDGSITVRATERGLETAFGNLIGNAIKYTPPGGSVRLTLEETDRCIAATVADTGMGIPEKDLSRLGDEFFRAGNAKRAGIQGTGLGLSIVKQLIDRFGGELEIASQEGEGTTVAVRLPAFA